MKIIVPMAGMGTRMRPHSLTIPKPLIPVAGKTIVHRLIEDITKVCNEKVDEIAFIVGQFGEAVEQNLISIAENLGAKGTIHYQTEKLGTAHAILCAAPALSGNIVVAFADTLFKADFKLDSSQDGIIWTSKVEDPSAFGVVKLNDAGLVEAFVEKPEQFISDQAIIGIYYFKDGDNLKQELQYLLDNDVRIKGGEFGLTDALENMNKKGTNFKIDTVTEWLDCGNKDATVYTNQRVLVNAGHNVSLSAVIENSTINEPCFIADGAVIKNSTVGPHVSVGRSTIIENSTISNSIIQKNSSIIDSKLSNSMLGSNVTFKGDSTDASIGDYSSVITK
jgi:glucose-1-phosphate thymidylyltransferase